MPFDKTAEAIIREAMQRGEFDNLRGKGKPLDLSQYFETPGELRMAYSVLKNAGMVPEEISLLQEIATLKERLAGQDKEREQQQVRKLISDKQLQYNLMMERRKR